MRIRPYKQADAAAIVTLFYETVRTVNAADYSPEQLRAWAPEVPDPVEWHDRMASRVTLVAEEQGEIFAFAEMDKSGYLDMFFCRRDARGQGIGSRLLRKIEARAQDLGLKRIVTEASITARPFFEARGFQMIKENIIERRGVELTNFTMEKPLE